MRDSFFVNYYYLNVSVKVAYSITDTLPLR